ncbi:MAG: septum formation inhibitor Maf [Bacteroidota bacterium]
MICNTIQVNFYYDKSQFMFNFRSNKLLIVSVLLFLIGVCACSDAAQPSKSGDAQQSREVKSATKDQEDTIFTPGHASETEYDVSTFAGEAEIATYTLERARYDGLHPGEAVLIFVSEAFLWKEQQVKADDPAGKNTVNVLKLNRIDRFTTGIYDYSMYTSVFTPTEKYDPAYPMKVTFSSQDWCGQVFAQINNDAGFRYRHFSYFENEGDRKKKVEYAIAEDNIMNICRINDTLLPTGDFQMIPSMSYLRTAHRTFQSYSAHGAIDRTDSVVYYNYEIPELKRSVRLELDPQKNNQIRSWTESYPTVFDGQIRTSTYRLKSSVKKDYWNFNSPEDAKMRNQLGL